MANVIRDTGVQASTHQALVKYLHDYPDKILIQYIKFGFPLSLRQPGQLSNTNVHNHPSAIQFPQAVEDYIKKEKSHEVTLVASKHYHCTPPQLVLRTMIKEGSLLIYLNLSGWGFPE